MSKHVEKYPGLYARCKAARVGYQVMYMRCRNGMTVDEALAIPVGKPGRKRKTPAPELPAAPRLFAWERPEWNAKARSEVPAKRPRKRHIRRIAEDTAPPHIQRLRTAYCDEFIRTGVLNETLGAKLREWAHAQRTSAKHSARVSTEHEVRRYGREETRMGDLGGGGADRIDEATARNIARYLRPE